MPGVRRGQPMCLRQAPLCSRQQHGRERVAHQASCGRQPAAESASGCGALWGEELTECTQAPGGPLARPRSSAPRANGSTGAANGGSAQQQQQQPHTLHTRPCPPPRPPGELFSDDDLYMTDAGLVVVETTNHIYNPDVYKVGPPGAPLAHRLVCGQPRAGTHTGILAA